MISDCGFVRGTSRRDQGEAYFQICPLLDGHGSLVHFEFAD